MPVFCLLYETVVLKTISFTFGAIEFFAVSNGSSNAAGGGFLVNRYCKPKSRAYTDFAIYTNVAAMLFYNLSGDE